MIFQYMYLQGHYGLVPQVLVLAFVCTYLLQGRRSLILYGQVIRENLGGLEYIVKVEPFSHYAKHNQHA